MVSVDMVSASGNGDPGNVETKPAQEGALSRGEANPIFEEEPIFVEMPEGLEELVPEFLDTQKEGARALERLFSGSEVEGIRRIAHNLKGAGTAFGFPLLTEMGGSMERSAREANLPDLRGQIRALTDYLDRVQLRRAGQVSGKG